MLVAMDRPWQWGAADCCTSACDAFLALHGIDPMASLRGFYHTECGAAREIAARGGFLKMCEDLATASHLLEGNGDAGEIGVVDVGDGRMGLSLCVGRGAWAVKTRTGFVTVHNVFKSWKCPNQLQQ